MSFRFIAVAAAAACLAGAAGAQSCIAPAEVSLAELVGAWSAQVDGMPAQTLQLSRHPEFAETARGWLEREGRRVLLAGDVDDGELTLEESADGVHITAVWLGDVVEGSCGREIRGTWKEEGAPKERAFVLTKKP